MSFFSRFAWVGAASVSRRRRILVGILLLLVISVAPATGDVRIVFANDFLASNELNDDLYTGALVIDYPVGRFMLTGGENLFTDSENNLRFDETFVHLGRSLAPRGVWLPRVELGVVHVGRGLLGENAQNAIHRVVGDDEVSFDYVEGNRVHATIRLVLERTIPRARFADLRFEADIAAAVGFKEHAIARLRASLPVTRGLRVDLSLGARYSHTSFDALRPRLETWGPTWEAALTIRDRVSMGWNYNRFGTKSQHFNIAYIAALGSKSRAHERIEPLFERRRRSIESADEAGGVRAP